MPGRGKQDGLFVFPGDDQLRLGNRPVYAQRRIIVPDAHFGLRRISVIYFIREYRFFAQHEEAVGKSPGYEKLPFVVFTQLY